MDPTEDLQPPAAFDQPAWKPPVRRPVSHRITAVSTRPGAWRSANPHTDDGDDGDNAYLYQGDHRLPGPDGNLIKGMVWAVIWLIIAAAIVYGLIEVGLWAYGSWTS
jgi:hypothetical protein